MTNKLRHSFAHPSVDKLLRLINKAGPKCSNNEELKTEKRNVSQQCQVSKIHKTITKATSNGKPIPKNFCNGH